MALKKLAEDWTTLGEQDPLWAIVSVPEKRGGAWELDEFLRTGERELAEVLGELSAREISFAPGRALDFGCGVGRLTQTLAEQFAHCDGVDIAAPMIEHARRLNRYGERCEFHHNRAANLRLFDDCSFDFVLSLIVLQHMKPRLMKRYLREFVRVLAPDGIAYFNVPDELAVVTGLPPEATDPVPEPAHPVPDPAHPVPDPLEARVEMHAMPAAAVVATIERAGGIVLDVFAKDRCGTAAHSLDYVVRRPLGARRHRGLRRLLRR